MKLSFPTKENHKALWLWLAKNPERDRREWPGFETIRKLTGKEFYCNCFLCEDPFFSADCFNNCPLHGCHGGTRVFVMWDTVKDSIEKARLATLIANCFETLVTKEAVDNIINGDERC